MNISQTRSVLTYMWATHPCTAKLDDDSKNAIIASYFRVLYKYSMNDVLDAVDRACRVSSPFLPSAYEIDAKCVKNPNVDAFLPPEYYELDKQFSEFKHDYLPELYLAESNCKHAKTDDEREEFQRQVDGIRARIGIEEQMRKIYRHAEALATEVYDREQIQMAQADLCALGYDRLALSE